MPYWSCVTVFRVCYDQFIEGVVIGYRSGPIGHVPGLHVSCKDSKGIGNVFPRQIRDFGNRTSHFWSSKITSN